MNKKVITGLMATLIGVAGLEAEENLWVYTKGTDTRPQGSYELKLSDIVRIGKRSGDYVFHDIRPEIEYGVTDRLTVGAEVMIFSHDYQLNEDIPPFEAGKSFSKIQLAGYELMSKYNFLSPYKDAFGLSMGLGYEKRWVYRLDGAEISQHSLVHTLFFQKNWLDNTLQWAVNWKTELERRRSGEIVEKEIALDISTGISYRVKPKHFIGLELRRQSDHLNPYNTETGEYEGEGRPSDWGFAYLDFGHQFQNGLYFGPTYHYAEKNWWFTTGLLYQISGDGAAADGAASDGKNWDEHELFHLGMTYGYEF